MITLISLSIAADAAAICVEAISDHTPPPPPPLMDMDTALIAQVKG